MNNNSDIKVRFGDLISSLEKKYDNIDYSIITTMGDNGSKRLKDVLNKYNLDSTYQRMIVTIKSDNNFKYRFFIPFTITDKDANGKMLIDHLDVNVDNNGKKKSLYTTVVVSKDVENVMLSIDNNILNRKNDNNFYPSHDFKNIVSKKLIKRK